MSSREADRLAGKRLTSIFGLNCDFREREYQCELGRSRLISAAVLDAVVVHARCCHKSHIADNVAADIYLSLSRAPANQRRIGGYPCLFNFFISFISLFLYFFSLWMFNVLYFSRVNLGELCPSQISGLIAYMGDGCMMNTLLQENCSNIGYCAAAACLALPCLTLPCLALSSPKNAVGRSP